MSDTSTTVKLSDSFDIWSNSIIDQIVKHTSTEFWEFEEYLNLADEFGYKTSVLVVENHHNGKSPHGVPEEKLNVMRRRFDLKL
jgi:hypothetical protein